MYANVLDVTKVDPTDMSLPPTLLVEEGKHAVATDRNADGHYTRGYDVNVRPHDAWGIRDEFGSGYLWSAILYSSSGNKPRHGAARVMVDAGPRTRALWSSAYRADWWPLPTQVYDLRPVPRHCERYCQPHSAECWRDGGLFALLVQKDIIKMEPPNLLMRAFYAYGFGVKPRLEFGGSGVGFGYLTRLRCGRRFGLWVTCLNGVMIGQFPYLFREPRLDTAVSFSPSRARPMDFHFGAGYSYTHSGEHRGHAFSYEGGIELRWLPRFVISVGVRDDTTRRARAFVEGGLF